MRVLWEIVVSLAIALGLLIACVAGIAAVVAFFWVSVLLIPDWGPVVAVFLLSLGLATYTIYTDRGN